MVLLLGWLGGGVICAATPSPLRIALSADKGQYLLGEPAALECTLENQSEAPLVVACDLSFAESPCTLHIAGPIRKECVVPAGRYEIGAYVAPPPLAPHQRITRGPILISDYGAVDPGEYEFWVTYDAEQMGAAGLRSYLTAVRAESNHLRLRLVEPTGEDLAAFRQAANACNQVLFSSDVLLRDFPTSTYAGYFLGLGEGFPMILDSKPEYVVKTLWEENYLEGHPLATLKTEAVQGGGQKPGMRTVAMRGYLEEQRGKIDKYLAVHPDHARREIMELARAYQSLALGDKDTAVRSLEWVAGQAPSEKWRDQAQAILDAMKRKGWVKE
jgi:hypothetical protein